MERRDGFQTLRFIRLSGPDGARWADQYESHDEAARVAQESTILVRRKEFGPARAALDRAEAIIERLHGCVDATVRRVVERGFYGAAAFLAYATDDYALADQLLEEAERSVVAALQESRYTLVLFALDCWEIQLQHARAARARRDWGGMEQHLIRAERMRAGTLPFCTLPDGEPIWLADLQHFCRAIPCAEPEDREMLGAITDPDASRLRGEIGTRLVLRLPGAVVQYP